MGSGQDLFELSFQQAPIGMCLCAAQGIILRVNDRLLEMCGHAAEDLLGRGFDTLVHADGLAATPSDVLQFFAGTVPAGTFEIRCVKRDGAIRWWRVNATRLVAPGGTTTHILCVLDDISAQKAMEAHFLASDATKRAILEALPDLLLVVDREYRFVDFHAPDQSELFVPPSGFLGKTILEVLPEPARSVCAQLVADVLRTGVLHTAEYSLPIQGKTQYYQCRAVRCARGVLVMVQNVTTYRRALDALRESEELLRRSNERLEQLVEERTLHLRRSEERYRKIVEDQTELIGRRNFTDHVLFVNDAVCRYLNLPAEEILHRPFLPYVHEEDVPALKSHLATLTPDSPVGTIEHRLRLPSGAIRWTQWTNRAFFDAAGNCVEIQSVGRDVTEQKHAEAERARLEHERRLAQEAVAASERRLRQILDAVFGYIGLYSLDGTLLDANRAPLEAAGLTRDDVIGKPFWDTYWWNYDARAQAELRDALMRAARGEVVRYEPTARMADGKLIDVDVTFSPLRDSSGAITGIVGFAIDITEKKQAAAQLQEQARLLDLIFEHSLDCIVLLDRDYNFLRVNQAYARACGRDVAEFVGRNHFELYPSLLKEEFDQALRQHTIYRCHARPFVFPDRPELGVTYWDLSMVPIRGAASEPELLLFTLRDVTEQKRAQEKLHASEARWRAFIDHATDAFFIHDAEDEGRIVDVNRQACESLGYTREELIGCRPADLDPNVNPAWLQQLDSRISAGDNILFDSQHRRKDGSAFPVAIRIRPFAFQGKRYALAVVRDITERRRAERLLRENQERLAGLVESAMDAIVCINEQLEVIVFNPAAERMFGIPAAQMLGKPLDCLIPEPSRASHAKKIRDFGNTGPSGGHTKRFGRVRGLRADGTIFPIEAAISQVSVGGHKVYTAILRDITDRIRAEEALHQSLSEKEALLKEVHHRVKNNLQIINSLLNLQAAKIKDATIRAMLADSQNRIRSMALVHETLFRSGHLGLVNLTAYLEGLAIQLFRAYGANPAQIRLKVEVPRTQIDLERAIPCGLIVNELVSNALKHAFPNQRSGNIRVALERAAGTHYSLTVTDDGIGLPAESVRAESTLGLQLVRDLAQQLGGLLNCEQAAAGTTVRIIFPIDPPR